MNHRPLRTSPSSGSGGGLFVSSSGVDLEHVVFSSNVASASGGALRVSHGQVHGLGCEFRDNSAVKGGGAVDLSYDSAGEFTDADFQGNSASWGGAISVRTGSSSWCYDSTFTGNTAVAPHEMGGAYFADYAASVVFQRCLFSANAARQGGAVRMADAASLFTNCTLDGNAAWEYGAGLMVRGGSLVLDHSIVSFNQGPAVTSEESSIVSVASNIFGNLGGDWLGDLVDQRDRDENMADDPLYCEAGAYFLQDSSPCAPGNNPAGLIGAFTPGCENVSIMLEDFDSAVLGHEIHLTWQVGVTDHLEFNLEGRARALEDPETWSVPYSQGDTPGSFRAIDKPSPDLGPIEYRLEACVDGGEWFFLGELSVTQATAIPDQPLTVNKVFPNPFNPRVNVLFTLAESAHVQAAVFDLKGRKIRTLANRTMQPGEHRLDWDSRDEGGRSMSAGTYLLRITDGRSQHNTKIQLVK